MTPVSTLADPPPIRGRFDGRTHLFPVRVGHEETDLSGIDQRAATNARYGPYAITAMALRFVAPARLDDALTVESTTEAITPARVVIHQTVRRGTDNLLTAHVTAAFQSPAGWPRRQPADWIAAFQTLLPNGAP